MKYQTNKSTLEVEKRKYTTHSISKQTIDHPPSVSTFDPAQRLVKPTRFSYITKSPEQDSLGPHCKRKHILQTSHTGQN